MIAGLRTHLLVLTLLFPGLTLGADELRIAVAANFVDTLDDLVSVYLANNNKSNTTSTAEKILISSGSSGKLYAQIVNGAPYDIFLSADSTRPARLEEQGIGTPNSRFTYAVGQLVLWSPDAGVINQQAPHIDVAAIRFLAIANPQLAPYGMASMQTLESISAWQKLRDKLVRGENINQAFLFVSSGNANAGLVALSQLIRTQQLDAGSYWLVPETMHTPIVQQALVLDKSADAFADFVQSEVAKNIIQQRGYKTPE